MLSRRTGPLSRLAARLSPRRAALSTAADDEPFAPSYETSPGPLSDPSEFHSVEHLLAEHLPPDAHRKVMGAMYGLNAGAPVAELPLPPAAAALAAKGDFDVVLHKFGAAAESREPRIVRFGVTQNCIRAPTTAPINEQYQALQDRHEEFIEAAAAAGTNVLCFQEARAATSSRRRPSSATSTAPRTSPRPTRRAARGSRARATASSSPRPTSTSAAR